MAIAKRIADLPSRDSGETVTDTKCELSGLLPRDDVGSIQVNPLIGQSS